MTPSDSPCRGRALAAFILLASILLADILLADILLADILLARGCVKMQDYELSTFNL